jgi:hypothetical protein
MAKQEINITKINGKRVSSNCLNQSITHVTPANR